MRDWLLVQEQFCSLYATIRMKPLLDDVVIQEIGQRQ